MSDVYVKYYAIQSGSGFDKERFGPILRFSPKYQRGRGLGGVFAGLLRYLKPMLSSGLKFLIPEAINTGADLLTGINQQKPIKEILRDRSLKIVDNIRDKAVNKINNMSGSGRLLHQLRKRKTVKNKCNSRKKCSKTINLGSIIKNTKKGIKRQRNSSAKHSKKHRVLDIFS